MTGTHMDSMTNRPSVLGSTDEWIELHRMESEILAKFPQTASVDS